MSGAGGRAGAALVLATGNPGKLAEVRAILAARGLRVYGLAGLAPVAFPEEGHDYEANALAKARAAARALGRAALADDSGLEVAGLGGAPGPGSARFGGPRLDDAGRVAALLERMRGLRGEQRAARFVCVAAHAAPDGTARAARGECAGRILDAPRGTAGFGYDPVFEIVGTGRAMAELTAAEKNRLSHRARAFLALCDALYSSASRS